MNTEKKINLSVGLFVFITLLIIIFGIIATVSYQVFNLNYYTIKTEFTHLSGLEINNDVKLKGYNIGKVKSIKLNQDNGYKFIVELSINKEIKIDKYAVAKVGMIGIGGKHIEIIPSGNALIFVKEGDTIKGKDSPVQNLVESVQGIAEKLMYTVDKVNAFLGGEGSDSGIQDMTKNMLTFLKDANEYSKKLLTNFEIITNNIKSLTTNADKLIEKNKSKFNNITVNIDENLRNLKELNEKLNNFLDRNHEKLDNVIVLLEKDLKQLNTFSGNANEIISGNKEELITVIKNLTLISKDMVEVASGLKNMTSKNNQEQINILLQDLTKFSKEARELINELKHKPYRLLWKTKYKKKD